MLIVNVKITNKNKNFREYSFFLNITIHIEKYIKKVSFRKELREIINSFLSKCNN